MTATLNETISANNVQVVSTPPAKVADFEHCIEWSRRSTDKNPVPEAQRYRAIVIPAAQLKVPDDACNSKFQRVLQSTIHELAQAFFVTKVKDDLMKTQLDGTMFTIDNVLAFWAEEKQRASVDGDKIKSWLPTSATWKDLSEAQRKVWLTEIPKLAAPSYQQVFSKAKAAVIVGRIKDDDLSNTIAAFILQRCNKILSAAEEANADAF